MEELNHLLEVLALDLGTLVGFLAKIVAAGAVAGLILMDVLL